MRQFVEDYQRLGLDELRIKYEGEEYWDIIRTPKILKYLKDNGLTTIMIEKDQNASIYTALTHHGNRHKLNVFQDEKWF